MELWLDGRSSRHSRSSFHLKNFEIHNCKCFYGRFEFEFRGITFRPIYLELPKRRENHAFSLQFKFRLDDFFSK